MTIASIVVLNALACENAKHPTCVCACGGKYHGLGHPLEWVQGAIANAELKAIGQLSLEMDGIPEPPAPPTAL